MRRMIVSSLVLVALALIAAIAAPAAAALSERRATERLALDIAEDATRFVFDQDVATTEGMPAAGSAFITHGYLYPAGTLTCDESGCNGVNPDGTPEFPDSATSSWNGASGRQRSVVASAWRKCAASGSSWRSW